MALLEKRGFLYNHSGDFPQVILIVPNSEDFEKKIFGYLSKKFGSAYAQSPRKCSYIEILAKIEGKEAKLFSKIYEGNMRI